MRVRVKTGWGVLGLGAALLVTTAVQARPKPPAEDPVQCSPLGQGRVGVDVAWGRATSTESCFFFSGPYDLGRDDHLGAGARYERSDDGVVVRFEGLAFAGRVVGDRVVLRRTSDHEFGSTWTVTEEIDVRFVEVGGCTVLRGVYRYNECDASRPQSCPGMCTISAPVTFTAR